MRAEVEIRDRRTGSFMRGCWVRPNRGTANESCSGAVNRKKRGFASQGKPVKSKRTARTRRRQSSPLRFDPSHSFPFDSYLEAYKEPTQSSRHCPSFLQLVIENVSTPRDRLIPLQSTQLHKPSHDHQDTLIHIQRHSNRRPLILYT